MKTNVILITLFFGLAVLASLVPFFGFDIYLTNTVQSYTSPIFDQLMKLVSLFGDPLYREVIFVLTLAVLFRFGFVAEAVFCAISTLSSIGIGALVKLIVHRPRPSDSLIHVLERLQDNSFPSLHVLSFTVFYGFIFYIALHKIKISWLRLSIIISSLILISLVSISRVYLGVHWASDTLGGYLLGLIVLVWTINTYHHYDKYFKR